MHSLPIFFGDLLVRLPQRRSWSYFLDDLGHLSRLRVHYRHQTSLGFEQLLRMCLHYLRSDHCIRVRVSVRVKKFKQDVEKKKE